MLREIEIWQNNFLFFSHHPSFQMCFFSLCVFQVFCFADALLLLIDANLKTFALYLIIISMPFRWTWFLCMIFTKIRVSWHKTFELNRRPKETVALHLYGIEKWNVSDVNVIIFFFFWLLFFFSLHFVQRADHHIRAVNVTIAYANALRSCLWTMDALTYLIIACIVIGRILVNAR